MHLTLETCSENASAATSYYLIVNNILIPSILREGSQWIRFFSVAARKSLHESRNSWFDIFCVILELYRGQHNLAEPKSFWFLSFPSIPIKYDSFTYSLLSPVTFIILTLTSWEPADRYVSTVNKLWYYVMPRNSHDNKICFVIKFITWGIDQKDTRTRSALKYLFWKTKLRNIECHSAVSTYFQP